MSLQSAAPPPDAAFHRVATLLGGEPLPHRDIDDPMDAHALILEGLPGRALMHLLDGCVVPPLTESLERAVGIGLRTFQRREDAPDTPLTPSRAGGRGSSRKSWNGPCGCSARARPRNCGCIGPRRG